MPRVTRHRARDLLERGDSARRHTTRTHLSNPFVTRIEERDAITRDGVSREGSPPGRGEVPARRPQPAADSNELRLDGYGGAGRLSTGRGSRRCRVSTSVRERTEAVRRGRLSNLLALGLRRESSSLAPGTLVRRRESPRKVNVKSRVSGSTRRTERATRE